MKTTPTFQPSSRFRKQFFRLFCLSLLASPVAGFFLTENYTQTEIQKRLSIATDNLSKEIEFEFTRLSDSLFVLQAHFQHEDLISRGAFKDFILQAQFKEHFPGAQSFSYIKLLRSHAELETIAGFMKRQGFAEYHVWPPSKDTLKSSLLYVEPMDGLNSKAIGFNLFTNKARKSAFELSLTSGRPIATSLLSLVSHDSSRADPGFLIVLPHGNYPRENSTKEIDLKNVEGVFGIVFIAEKFFDRVITNPSLRNNHLKFKITENNSETDLNLVYSNMNTGRLLPFSATKEVQIPSRTWTIEASPTPQFLNSSERFTPYAVAIALFILSVLIFLFLRFSQKSLENETTLKLKALSLAQKARQANETKSSFLANMSHEIRTPLGVILGYSELLMDPQCSQAERLKMFQSIQTNGATLTTLLSDILDSSKMEAGKLGIDEKPFSFGQLLSEVENELKPKVEAKNIQLTLTGSHPGSSQYLGDPIRIKQILTNVINNSIRFTNEGGVHITFGETEKNSEKFIFANIADTGIGMDGNAEDFLFKAFSQADTSATRKYGGTGLGLHLSRNLAQQMNGDLSLTSSELGKGSTFRFEMRARLAAPQTSADPGENVLKLKSTKPTVKLGPKRILLVEDSIDNQQIFTLYLKQTGVSLDLCDNGYDALKTASSKSFDLILMDIQLPGIDGREVTRRLRKNGLRTPIIAITAHAQIEEVNACLQAGCDGHLSKPFSKTALIDKIAAFIEPAEAKRSVGG